MTIRRTVVLHGSLIRRNMLLEAARSAQIGVQFLSFDQLAARLAGGFASEIDNKFLRDAIRSVLPETDLGEIDPIKMLPGMIPAAAETLQKVWRAKIDLQSRRNDHPRIASIAMLEEAALARLPMSMMRPFDLVERSLSRIHLAKTLFGPIKFVGMTELSPVWRDLLYALASHTDVVWEAGPRSVPAWIDEKRIPVIRSQAEKPETRLISAANAYHEAIEAVRWARELIASGKATPDEIAIVSTMPGDYDDHLIALRSDANIDICFVHGVKVTTTRAGQAAAALADVLVRGLSQSRLRRLSGLLSANKEAFGAFPTGWIRILPKDAPLISLDSWNKFLNHLSPDEWPEGNNQTEALREIIHLLARRTDAANEAGERLLTGQARKIWREALKTGSSAAIDVSINNLRISECANAPTSIAWMTANELAAAPRPFVRLLGLNSSKWPRSQSEDRLLSDHIIPTGDLDPLPINAADRRDFETIRATTKKEIIMSFSRRDSEGRLLGKSPLVPANLQETYLQRNNTPLHAMSETDRLLARRSEFVADPQGAASVACWRDWFSSEVTPHDGLIRADHPVIGHILNRVQSASSLRLLLRYPISFVWKYGLHLTAPECAIEPIILQSNAVGELIHETLELALIDIQNSGGLSLASVPEIELAIERAVSQAAQKWEVSKPTPPRLIWDLTLQDIKDVSLEALRFEDDVEGSKVSYCEVPFGGSKDAKHAKAPWDTQQEVIIPRAHFRIGGYIDRLDVFSDGKRAIVKDYKTGKTPDKKKRDMKIDGGKELQRCLYSYAVRTLLAHDIEVTASLFYPRDGLNLILDDQEQTLVDLENYLQLARESLTSGACMIGKDAEEKYDDFAFLLPANARALYVKRKLPAVMDVYGQLCACWEAK